MTAGSSADLGIVWPRKANEIPKEVFTRADLFERELERIFYGPIWHIVAHVAELPKKGDFKRFELGRVPLLIARADDGVLRVFINSCTHRGTIVETEPLGNCRTFQCPYHRWNFKNDGRLFGAPNTEGYSPGFDKADYGLKTLRTAEFRGLVFATLSEDATDLETFLGPKLMANICATLPAAEELRLIGYQKTQYMCNWKVYVDNDGFHAPLLHTAFRLLQWQGGKGEQSATANGHAFIDTELVAAPAKNLAFLNDPSLIELKTKDRKHGSVAASIFPLSHTIGHLDVLSVRLGIAGSVNRTDVHYLYFARVDDSEEMLQHRIHQSSDLLGPCGMVSMEDAAVFQRVQAGSYSPGTAAFQHGVREGCENQESFAQNDESANLPRWDYYRKMMGLKREGE